MTHWGSSDAQDQNPYGMDYDGNEEGDGGSIFDAWDAGSMSASGSTAKDRVNPITAAATQQASSTGNNVANPDLTRDDDNTEHDPHPITQESEKVQGLFSFGTGVGDTYETLDDMIADDTGVWDAAKSLRGWQQQHVRDLLRNQSNTEGLRAAMTHMQRAIVEEYVDAARGGKTNGYEKKPQQFWQRYFEDQASQEDLIALRDLGSPQLRQFLDARFNGWEAGIGDTSLASFLEEGNPNPNPNPEKKTASREKLLPDVQEEHMSPAYDLQPEFMSVSPAYDLQPEFMRGQAGIIDQHNPGIGSRVSIDPATAYAKRGYGRLKRSKPRLVEVSSTIVNTDTVETADTNNNASLTTNNLTTNRTVDVNASGGVTEIETMEVASTGLFGKTLNYLARLVQVQGSGWNDTETLENDTVALTNSSENETVPTNATSTPLTRTVKVVEEKIPKTRGFVSVLLRPDKKGRVTWARTRDEFVSMFFSGSAPTFSEATADPYLFEAPGGREAYEKLINSFDYMDFEDAHTIGAPDAREQEMQQRVKSSLHHMDLLRKDEIARDSKNMWFTILVGAVSGVVIAHMYR